MSRSNWAMNPITHKSTSNYTIDSIFVYNTSYIVTGCISNVL